MKDITAVLSDAIIHDFNKMMDSSVTIYALSLVCNDTMDHFFLALADTTHLDRVLSKNKITDNSDLLYYKWATNEWQFFSYQLADSHLKEFNKQLVHSHNGESNDFNEYRKSMFESCISSLIEVKLKIEILKNIPVFLSFTDISKLEEIENYTAYRINSAAVYEAFKDRFSELDWGKNLGQYNPFK